MSEANPMEQATGHAVQTAAVALQVLILTARALSEASRREGQPTPQPVRAPQQTTPQPSADPDGDRYAHLVRDIVQPSTVADAMVSSPQWPQLARELKALEGAGVNIRQFLADAAPVIARMDTDIRAGVPSPGVTTSPAAHLPDPWDRPAGQDRAKAETPSAVKRMAERIKQTVMKIIRRFVRKDRPTALGERSRELARLGISAQENSRLVVVARESLADEKTLTQMVTSREWPRIASQISTLQQAGHNPRAALAAVPARMQQAAAAGISLSPAEAARGLLTDQSKRAPESVHPTPVQARSAAPASPSLGQTFPQPVMSQEARAAVQAAYRKGAAAARRIEATTPDAAATSRAAAASAQSTTATPGTAPAAGRQTPPAGPVAPARANRSHGR